MTTDQKLDQVFLEDVLRHSKDVLKWIGVLYRQIGSLEEFETQLDHGLIDEDSRINTAVHVGLVKLKSSLMKANGDEPKDLFSWLHKRMFDYSSHLPGRKAASYQIKMISEIDPIFGKTPNDTPNVELIALLAEKFYSMSFKADLVKVILG
ncbi:hypothetical protein TRICI_001536 [Trichomonascus ciferrii]|uniref:Uncharacterized protein n=1 Tax=Trichomonascus ciferrii TaxID=44093 RepID=A0A642VCI3_9ASCO|nr:hypothetical protein TRICI_001536 [Trichomonascus ciferrii]